MSCFALSFVFVMIREGEELAALHKNIVVKVPCIENGIKAIRYFAKKGIRTNCTLVFSVGQALLAAKAGATYVSPFVGRLDDISSDGIELVRKIVDMGVRKTVAEVENIDYIGMAESLDIGTVINKKMITASHIYQMMLDADVSNVKCLTFANADVAEFTVKEKSFITRHMDELQRIDSHLLFYSCLAMDLGALTAFFYGFRDREKILDIFEETCQCWVWLLQRTYSKCTSSGSW